MIKGLTTQIHASVDTEEWFTLAKQNRAITSIEYRGKKYKIEFESEKYSPQHRWSGQHHMHVMDLREFAVDVLGRQPNIGFCKRDEHNPNYELNELISDFLFDIPNTDNAEVLTYYATELRCNVDQEDYEQFLKDVEKVYNILKECKINLRKG